ncbi:MAG: cysteine synthase family protein [Saprospiraceae bacterium]|nr:cysteine synthase family protein [Saprospiraceae bacterium]
METILQNPVIKFSTSITKKLFNVGKLIGNTPMHRFNSLSSKTGVVIYAKLEWHQLGGSVKARAAFRIIEQAITTGELSKDKRLLDASSGNTGIAFGAIAASLGIPVTLCLPENASKERKSILKALGVDVILTDPFSGTDGAQEMAAGIYLEHPGKYFYANQYANNDNWKSHYLGTSREIFRQTGGEVSHFVCGLGTTGSFIGTGRYLKEMKQSIHLLALQPDGPMHGLEGWKDLETAKVPAIYDSHLANDISHVSTEEAYDLIRFVARHEGLLLSPSAAANLAGATRLAASLQSGSIVTLLPDNADKYGDLLASLNL